MLKRFGLGLLLLVWGCGGGGGGKGSNHPPPSVKRAATLIGYSIVNSWHLNDPETFGTTLEANGLTATEIEWAPFIGSPQVCRGTTNATYPDQARQWVEAMRKHNVMLYINIVNANGCAETEQPTEWFQEQLDTIKAMGIDGIILGGVSEPWANSDPKLHQWEHMAQDQWGGFFIAPANDGNAVPWWNDIEYDYLDSHPCSVGGLNALLNQHNTVLVPNTDCGPLTNPGPDAAAQFTRMALDTGSNLVIYDFNGTQPDVATIEAMGREIQR